MSEKSIFEIKKEVKTVDGRQVHIYRAYYNDKFLLSMSAMENHEPAMMQAVFAECLKKFKYK